MFDRLGAIVLAVDGQVQFIAQRNDTEGYWIAKNSWRQNFVDTPQG